MSHDLDLDLREAFAPLRGSAVTARHREAMTIAASRRRRRRSAGGGAALTAIAVAGLAALPSQNPGRSAPALSAQALLRSAAAAAADQPQLSAGDGYRYTRRIMRKTSALNRAGRHASITTQSTIEDWENAELQGREVLGQELVVERSGDAGLAATLADQLHPREQAQTIDAGVARGLGPVLRLAQLPQTPDELRAALEQLVRTSRHWAPGMLTEARLRQQVLEQARRLLSTAAAPPRARSATFLMLSAFPGVQALGERRSDDGRTGQAIQITLPADPDHYVTGSTVEILFDPDTTALLQITDRAAVQDDEYATPVSQTLYESAGQVPALGERP